MTSLPSSDNGERGQFQVTGRLVLFTFIGFFLVVASVNAVMMIAAVTTFGGVETRNAYQAGLAFNQSIAAAGAQDARHWRVEIRRQSQSGADFTLSVRDEAGQPISGLALDASLVHPTNRRRDRALDITATGAGVFRAAGAAEPGQWDLTIGLRRDDEQLFRSRNRINIR